MKRLFFLTCFLLICWVDFGFGQLELDIENIFFPDQIEYIKMYQRYCRGNLIYWPDGRCYEVGQQGPCNIGRILQFDRRYFKPFCTDESNSPVRNWSTYGKSVFFYFWALPPSSIKDGSTNHEFLYF